MKQYQILDTIRYREKDVHYKASESLILSRACWYKQSLQLAYMCVKQITGARVPSKSVHTYLAETYCDSWALMLGLLPWKAVKSRLCI